MFCDLHTHSTASDGTIRPEDLPALARSHDLQAIALTDHDTTTGLIACAAACEENSIAFVPGIEISADPGALNGMKIDENDEQFARFRSGSLHILGLFVRHDDPQLAVIHDQLQQSRQQRNPEIVHKLNELGVRMDYSEVLELAEREGTEVIGRPHIAQIMVRKGYAKSIQDAFSRYLASGKPAYVRKDRLAPGDAIDAIHHAGGLAIVAHPVQLRCTDDQHLLSVLKRLIDLGLDGMEVRHSDHPPAIVEQYQQIAEDMGLLASGGSDFHGSRKPIALGSQNVPLSVYEILHEQWQKKSRR